jgi:hypothetical protein
MLGASKLSQVYLFSMMITLIYDEDIGGILISSHIDLALFYKNQFIINK